MNKPKMQYHTFTLCTLKTETTNLRLTTSTYFWLRTGSCRKQVQTNFLLYKFKSAIVENVDASGITFFLHILWRSATDDGVPLDLTKPYISALNVNYMRPHTLFFHIQLQITSLFYLPMFAEPIGHDVVGKPKLPSICWRHTNLPKSSKRSFRCRVRSIWLKGCSMQKIITEETEAAI